MNAVEETKQAENVIKKKPASRDKLHPDPLAENNYHSTYKRDPVTGKITHYETYKPQTNPRNPNPLEVEKRYDGQGKSHNGVPTPHVHEGNDVRPAQKDEIPGN